MTVTEMIMADVRAAEAKEQKYMCPDTPDMFSDGAGDDRLADALPNAPALSETEEEPRFYDHM